MDDVHFSKNELYQMLLKKMQEVNPPASPIELDEVPTGEEISRAIVLIILTNQQTCFQSILMCLKFQNDFVLYVLFIKETFYPSIGDKALCLLMNLTLIALTFGSDNQL